MKKIFLILLAVFSTIKEANSQNCDEISFVVNRQLSVPEFAVVCNKTFPFSQHVLTFGLNSLKNKLGIHFTDSEIDSIIESMKKSRVKKIDIKSFNCNEKLIFISKRKYLKTIGKIYGIKYSEDYFSNPSHTRFKFQFSESIHIRDFIIIQFTALQIEYKPNYTIFLLKRQGNLIEFVDYLTN